MDVLEALRAGRDPRLIGPRQTFGSGVGDFLASALSAPLELFGAEPSFDVKRFREEHPVLGFVSQVPGIVGAFGAGGAIGGALRLGRLGRVAEIAQKGAKLFEHPVAQGVAREVIRFAPFEAARLASGLVLEQAGEEGALKRTAQGVAFDLAVGLPLAGAISAVRQFGPPRTPRVIEPGANPFDDPTKKFIDIRNVIRSGAVAKEALPAAERGLIDAEKQIYAGRGELFDGILQPLRLAGSGVVQSRLSPKAATTRFKNLLQERIRFEVDPDTGKKFRVGEIQVTPARRVVNNLELIRDALRKTGLPQGLDGKGANLTFIRHATERGGRRIRTTLGSLGVRVGKDTYLLRKEAVPDRGRGMFIVARKVPSKSKKTGMYVLFETNDPVSLIPEVKKISNLIPRGVVRQISAAESPFRFEFDDAPPNVWQRIQRAIVTAEELDKRGLAAEQFSSKVLERLPKDLREGLRGTVVETGRLLRDYLQPTEFAFRRNPLAAKTMAGIRQLQNEAESFFRSLYFGSPFSTRFPKQSAVKTVLSSSKEILFSTVSRGKRPPVMQLINNLSDDDLAKLTVLTVKHTGDDEAFVKALEDLIKADPKLADASHPVRQVLDELLAIDNASYQELSRAFAATGKKAPPFKPAHFGISRSWLGTHRVMITDESGRLVYIASGKTRAQALAEADAIVDAARQADVKLLRGDAFEASRLDDIELAKRLNENIEAFRVAQDGAFRYRQKVLQPATFRARKGKVGGFTGDAEPLTRQDLRELIEATINRNSRLLVDLGIERMFGPALVRIQEQDPRLFDLIRRRIEIIQGKPGKVDQVINKAADRVLGPLLGERSAQKLVSAINSTLFTLHFGFVNTTFLATNILTPLQTTLPMIYFRATAPRDVQAGLFSYLPAFAKDGTPVGILGVADTFKLIRDTFRLMANPHVSKDYVSFLRRAITDGTIAPTFAEAALGETGDILSSIRNSLSSGGIASWLKSSANFLATKSEELSRLTAFTMAFRALREAKFKDPNVFYNAVKELTGASLARYTALDRPLALTGTVGTTFGLFKNFSFNYYSWMLEYTSLALARKKFAPLLAAGLATGVLGGVRAMPFFFLADGLSRALTDKSLLINLQSMFGDGADEVYYGLPAFAGITISNMTTAPFADPTIDASLLGGLVHLTRAQALGKAVGTGFADLFIAGKNPFDDKLFTSNLIRAVAPRTLQRIVQATEDGTLRSLNTANPLLRDLTPAQRVLFSLGFDPVQIQKSYDVARELYRNQTKRRLAVKTLGRALGEALQEGNSEGASEIIRQATALGIASSVVASARNHFRQEKIEDIFSKFNEVEVQRRLKEAGLQ